MITTGLTLHTYPLSKLLLLSSTLAITYALSIFNQIPNPTIFLFNTLIAFSLNNRLLSYKTLTPNSFTFPSLF
jgi:hypothetical protein